MARRKKLKSRLSLSQQKLSLTVKSGIATKPNMVFDYNISMTGAATKLIKTLHIMVYMNDVKKMVEKDFLLVTGYYPIQCTYTLHPLAPR